MHCSLSLSTTNEPEPPEEFVMTNVNSNGFLYNLCFKGCKSVKRRYRKNSLEIRFKNKFISLLGKCHLILLTAPNEKNEWILYFQQLV